MSRDQTARKILLHSSPTLLGNTNPRYGVGPNINQRGDSVRGGSSEHHGHGAEEHSYVSIPEDRNDALMKYAMLLADGQSKKDVGEKQHIDNIVKGIIEGETRVLVSSMTMEEIFTERTCDLPVLVLRPQLAFGFIYTSTFELLFNHFIGVLQFHVHRAVLTQYPFNRWAVQNENLQEHSERIGKYNLIRI